jgi:hypothetical protein
MFMPARPFEIWSRVTNIFAAMAGLWMLACTVAQIFTLSVASARPAIMVIDSRVLPQWSVEPPKPRHLAIDITKSRPACSASTAVVLLYS